jgi:hypothetical protein
MSPITGMTRGTSRDRYSKEPSSSALMPGMRLCPSRNVHADAAAVTAARDGRRPGRITGS